MKTEKPKNIFMQGAIPAHFIGDAIAKHQSKTTIGAHTIFLGQVRADTVNGKIVAAINYSAYEEMANQIFHEIRETAFEKFNLTCMHVYHSLGKVEVGQVCLFVFVSSPHRQSVFDALSFIVEAIKDTMPVFGKEFFENATHQWKINK